MQPLIANSINVNDVAVPFSGLPADISLIETPRNFGTLGDVNEPLLAAALADIEGAGRFGQPSIEFRSIKTDFNIKPFEESLLLESDQVFFRKEFE